MTILVVSSCTSQRFFVLARVKELGHTVVCLNEEKNEADPHVDEWILVE